MVMDQNPAPIGDNVDMTDHSTEVIETNSVPLNPEAVNVGGKMIGPAVPSDAPGPSIKSIVVGGPVLISASKSPLQPRALFKVLNFLTKNVPSSHFSWLSLMDIDPNTPIPSFINYPYLLVHLAFLLPPQNKDPSLEKEELKLLQEEDDEDLMEISGTNFTPRKRRHVKVREQLEDSFLRCSKRISDMKAGFKDVRSADEAVAEPQPLAIIPVPGSTPAPHLTKNIVQGITEGFLQIHPSVVSTALLDQDVNDDKNQ